MNAHPLILWPHGLLRTGLIYHRSGLDDPHKRHPRANLHTPTAQNSPKPYIVWSLGPQALKFGSLGP